MKEKREAITAKGVFFSPLFSQAIRAGNRVSVSGIVAMNANNELVGVGDFRQQAAFVFGALHTILKANDSGMSWLLKVEIYLTDRSQYPALNDIWRTRVLAFCQPPPARVTVVSQLVLPSLLIEVAAEALVKAE